MEVILQEDFPALGYVGDRVTVKRGYARNFLVPQGFAVEITTTRAKALEHRMNQILAKKRKLKVKAEEFAKTLSEVKLEFKLRMGEKGKSFGSITTKDIHDALAKAGYEVERKQVRLVEPIKTVGEHKVSVKLHSEVSAEILIDVSSQAPRKKKKSEEEMASGNQQADEDGVSFEEALAAEDLARQSEGSSADSESDDEEVDSQDEAASSEEKEQI